MKIKSVFNDFLFYRFFFRVQVTWQLLHLPASK